MNPPTLLIVNPASAGGRTSRRWPGIVRALRHRGVRCDVEVTDAPGDAGARTRDAIARGVERLLILGGDGTLTEAVNGFLGEDGSPRSDTAVLGILPSGTGDDVARNLGIQATPQAWATMLEAATVRRLDVGRIEYLDDSRNPRFFLNVADCGIGGEIAARVNASRQKAGGLRGSMVFLGVTVAALWTYRPSMVAVDFVEPTGEMRQWHGTVTALAVANGRTFGGGMRIAPHAVPDDGLFDVVLVSAVGRGRTLRGLASIYRGAHVRRSDVEVVRAREVVVRPFHGRDLRFDIDGDVGGMTPARLTCLPTVVPLLCPPGLHRPGHVC